MKNWLGQEIKPGDVVGRGAREGNTSSFKIGVVDVIDDKGIRVNWLYELGIYHVDKDNKVVVPHRRESKGRPALDSLFRLTYDQLWHADVKYAVLDLYRQGKLTKEQFLDKMRRD